MNLILLGASNPHIIKTILDINEKCHQYDILGFLDNDPSKQKNDFFGYPVLGGYEKISDLAKSGAFFINLITRDTLLRCETTRHLIREGAKLINIIHPSVNTRLVEMGIGNSIEDNVTLQAYVRIGDNCAIDSGTVIAHETIVGNGVFFAPGVSVAGRVTINDGVFLGTNCTVFPRVVIGKWATIGAGTVITRDIPDYAVVFGNPPRVKRYNTPVYDDASI